MPRIAIVAAMEREVAPLIRKWQSKSIERDGSRSTIYRTGEAALICAGIGSAAARRATETIIRETQPSHILSVGFAGALDAALKVGHIFEPRVVIDASDGSRTDTGYGSGTLLTVAAVAGMDQKLKLRDAYRANAVDMEAAAVAQGAAVRGITFGVVKAISDEVDFVMPPVARFVRADGKFRSGRFALHVGVRPWLWRATISLAVSSAKASQALCAAIERYLSERVAENFAHT